MKPILPFVETMIVQACNLSCEGCTNYSDLIHSGYVTWEEGKENLEQWLERIDIPDFGIMGGEPLINPQVRDWLIGVRELMPNSQIRLTTNGLLLERHWDIIQLMHDLGNTLFKITVHTPDQLNTVVQKVYDSYDWHPVTEFGIDRHATTNNFRFQVNRPSSFLKTFKGEYRNMAPCNSNPVEAFSSCIQQTCPLLYNGRIYKCSTSGLLEDTLKRFNYPNYSEWKDYIPKGIAPDSKQEDIIAFIKNFGRPDGICAQCPTSKNTELLLSHLDTVTFKSSKKLALTNTP